MIKIFKTTESVQSIISEYEENSWINVASPGEGELKMLSQRLNVPEDFLTSPLDVDERPRIEVEEKNMLVLIRTPHFDASNDIQFTTVPLGIILTDNMIITVCSNNNNDVIQAFADGKIKGWSSAKRSRFVLQIFSRTALIYLDYLKRINKETSLVEDRLQVSMKNEELIELQNFEKSLVYFTTSLRANELVMERLQRTEMLKMYPEDKELLEDVIIENRQAIEMANIHTNILTGMMDAFASVISNNLNKVVKLLTAITIILMLPNLVASIYGMNVDLPLQRWPHAFAFTMSMSIILSVLGVILFVRRKWF